MRKYTCMSLSAKVLLGACLTKAKAENHKIIFKCRHEDNLTDNHQLIPGSAEFEDFKFELKDDSIELCSPFDYENCMEMSIEIIDGAEKFIYELWYQDTDEDRVYVDNIDYYLSY